MGMRDDLKKLIHPYYLFNLALGFSFIALKTCRPFCTMLFPHSECQLDSRESEILFFLLVVVMIRSRKTGSMAMLSYISSSFIYCKVANAILWFYTDIRAGLLYMVLFVMQGLLCPEPLSDGPDKVVYFRGPGLQEELIRDKKVSWIVAFYAAWSPSSVNFAPIFSQLSCQYSLPNLKWGKIDVGRYPDVAKKMYISDSSLSRQLPTVILFQQAKEITRRPYIDDKGKIQKFFFTEDNLKAALDLNNLYAECKSKCKELNEPTSEKAGHAKAE